MIGSIKDELDSKLDGIEILFDELLIKDAAIRAENARLRAALEAVEWVADPDGEHYDHCAWCYEVEWKGHKPDCPRQVALGLQP